MARKRKQPEPDLETLSILMSKLPVNLTISWESKKGNGIYVG